MPVNFRGLAAALRSGSENQGSRRAGVNTLNQMDRQEGLDRRQSERLKADEDKTAKGLVNGVLKSHLAETLESLKSDTDPGQRFEKLKSAGLLLGRLGVSREASDAIIKQVEQTPFAKTDEQQRQFDLTNEADKALIKGATGQGLLNFVQGGSKDRALLEQRPEKDGGFSLRPDQQRFDAEGNLIATNTRPKQFSQGRTGDKASRVERSLERKRIADQAQADNPELLGNLYQAALARLDLMQSEERITGSEGKKRREGLARLGTAMTSFDSSAKEVLEIIDDPTRNAAATGAGDLARGILGMTANIQGMTGLIPNVHPNVELDQTAYATQLKGLSKDNAVLRSAMFSIALQNAVAQGLAQGGRLSNETIKRAIKDVGADVRNPGQIRDKLVEVRRRLSSALRERLKLELGDYSTLNQADSFRPEQGSEPELPNIEDMSFEEVQAELERRGQQ